MHVEMPIAGKIQRISTTYPAKNKTGFNQSVNIFVFSTLSVREMQFVG